MRSAKEGSRTPTRVTPPEPEGGALFREALSLRRLAYFSWSKVRPQKAARIGVGPQNCGARTGSPVRTFRSPLTEEDMGDLWRRTVCP